MRKSAFAAALLLCVGISVPSFAQTIVEVQINNTASPNDDYLCWNPMRARARAIAPMDAPLDVLVTFETSGTGAVGFSYDAGAWPTAATHSPSDQIVLTLPSNGAWVPFFVAGTEASTLNTAADGNDVRVVVMDASNGAELGAVTIMVRVRKDAETLTEAERDILLGAVATLHGHRRSVGPGGDYVKYADIHEAAFSRGIHGGRDGNPLFLAWHRAFLLSLERELQAIDPRVALPYWSFDAPSSRLFTEDFMGALPNADGTAEFEVQFSDANPLDGWYTRSEGPLTRRRTGGADLTTVLWTFDTYVIPLPQIFGAQGADLYRAPIPANGFNSRSELNYHNGAHAYMGGTLGRAASPLDPLFFLLHTNVDRAWADWQAQLDRFDYRDVSAYPDQGRFPGDGMRPLREGSYVDDLMWPWSGRDGSDTPAEDLDDWPGMGFAFPIGHENHGPVQGPTPGSMIDYMGQTGVVPPLGMCYDNLGYGAQGGQP